MIELRSSSPGWKEPRPGAKSGLVSLKLDTAGQHVTRRGNVKGCIMIRGSERIKRWQRERRAGIPTACTCDETGCATSRCGVDGVVFLFPQNDGSG
jgi:hypothetical protein